MNKQLLQQCLDALCLPCARWNKTQTLIINKAIEALRKELEKPESEVVAWIDNDGNISDNNDHKMFNIPLYTLPPDTEALRAELEKIKAAIGNEQLAMFIEKHGGPVPIVQELERVKGERDELHQHLKRIKHCLIGTNEKVNGPISDTIWYSESETLFDYIDAAIEAQGE